MKMPAIQLLLKNYLWMVLLLLPCEAIFAQKHQVQKTVAKADKQGFDLTKLLPKGYKTDGSIDYTSLIQKGIDEHSRVIMPNFPVLINENGISARSNSSILFQKQSALIMQPNALSNYAILSILKVKNVLIESPVLIGERNLHTGTKGEWGFGIQITASQNIRINSPHISNCWGDGIYIGGDEKHNCDSIRIFDAKIDSSRRNGISITDGKNIQIVNAFISNTKGTSPMCGIDIEPNNGNATLQNILISNLTTVNSNKAGISIILLSMPAKTTNTVSIKIENHIDRNSNIGFWLAKMWGDYTGMEELTGSIEVLNPKWYNNSHSLICEKFTFGPPTTFKNIKAYRDQSNGRNVLQSQEITRIKNSQAQNKKIKFED